MCPENIEYIALVHEFSDTIRYLMGIRIIFKYSGTRTVTSLVSICTLLTFMWLYFENYERVMSFLNKYEFCDTASL